MTANRKTLRTDLKTELAPLMTSLQSADDFYRYEPASYNKKSPIIFLRSKGAEHPEVTKKLNSEFFIEVHLLTLYADMVTGTYAEEAASDLLDDLENQLSAAVEAKRVVSNKWQKLSIEGRSDALPEPIGGEMWLHEVVTLQASLF